MERGLRRFETFELVRECLDPGRLELPSGRAWEAKDVEEVVKEVVKGSIPAADRLELELELERSRAPSCASFAMAEMCRLAAASSGVLVLPIEGHLHMRGYECISQLKSKVATGRKLKMGTMDRDVDIEGA